MHRSLEGYSHRHSRPSTADHGDEVAIASKQVRWQALPANVLHIVVIIDELAASQLLTARLRPSMGLLGGALLGG